MLTQGIERVAAIQSELANSDLAGRLTLLGPSYSYGIGVNDCIRNARGAAVALAGEHE